MTSFSVPVTLGLGGSYKLLKSAKNKHHINTKVI